MTSSDTREPDGHSTPDHLASAFTAQLDQLRANWAEALVDAADARAFIREYSDRLDAFLRALWQEYLDDCPAALLAVGGYGRQEMFPHSDIDILILVENRALDEQVQAFLYVLWDTGLAIGHSVRTLDDCIDAGRSDATVYTNMLDARLVAGKTALERALSERVRSDQMTTHWRFFQDKCHEQAGRYEAQDEVGARIEPNIKEGPGGLRDLQTMRWLANRVHGARTFADMHRIGLLRDGEYRALDQAEALLFRIRIGLHGLAERGEERLLLMHQKALAGHFGYLLDTDGNLAVEQFMQSYFRAVIESERLNRLLLQELREQLNPEPTPEAQVLNPRFQLRGNLLETRNAQVFMRSPTAILELFLLMAQHPELVGMSAATARQLRANLPVIDSGFRKNAHAHALFLALLRVDQGVYLALRNMNLTGVLAAYIPEFAPIVGRMQFDLFHVYTVDAHTLFVIRYLRRFSRPEYASEHPVAAQTFRRISQPELLYLAALFHDIAKGRGGDHAELGAIDVRRFATNHGFGPEAVDLVGWLVENHLLMSFTAQRRDIEDPEIIAEFAAQVGNTERLDYLFLLTVADIRATNPSLWNSWRNSLLKRLLHLTHEHFAQGTKSVGEIVSETRSQAHAQGVAAGLDRQKLDAWLATLPEDYFLRNETADILKHSALAIDAELPTISIGTHETNQTTQIVILAANHPAQFAHIVAEIDREGLNVQSANMTVVTRPDPIGAGFRANDSEGGTPNTPTELLLLEFFVLDSEGLPVADPWLIESLQGRLERCLAHPDLPLPRVRRRMGQQLSSFEVGTSIEFLPDNARARTLVQVTTKDRPGLLADLADALWREGAVLLHARISTLGERVEDAFYIVDEQGRPIEQPERQEQIRNALLYYIGVRG